MVSDQPYRIWWLIFAFLSAQQYFRIEKTDTAGVNVVCFDNGFICTGPDSNNEMLILGLQVIEQSMFLVAECDVNPIVT